MAEAGDGGAASAAVSTTPVLDEDLAMAEEILGKLTQLLDDPRMDTDELRQLLELCNDKLQTLVEQAFEGRSDEVAAFLQELMMAQLHGEPYYRVQEGDPLKDVVRKLRDVGVLEVSPEDDSLVRIAL
ncbi:hypothetical protein RP20_CCG020012 [Aedes albopictus]|nr:hypothetical protein RP20_CCG020012 [Aedes albopictus]